jgi:hypothetical protein
LFEMRRNSNEEIKPRSSLVYKPPAPVIVVMQLSLNNQVSPTF